MAPELLRLVAYCAGDGHLGRRRQDDRLRTRTRLPTSLISRVTSRASVSRAAFRSAARVVSMCSRAARSSCTRASVELGVAVGKKVYAWPERPFEWVFELPAWQRGVSSRVHER